MEHGLLKTQTGLKLTIFNLDKNRQVILQVPLVPRQKVNHKLIIYYKQLLIF